MSTPRSRRSKAVLAGVMILATMACATLDAKHGYVPEESALNDVVVGRDTRDTVSLIIGRPGTTGIVDESGWFYVRSDYERFLWREPVETNREVVAISFTEAGVVSNIERFGLEDGQVVVLNRRVTDSNIEGVSFLGQLFANFGNFNAGDFLEE